MPAKRALIVDDSKSARVVLARMLEKYGLEVDASESAEDAIEYLKSHRPDVIFMDHLMPGMDGFQAVQAIKSNPLTATIPIMMYTSQEGELYVGQARALGAIGVVPKHVAPVDVSKVLYQLKLLPDRRDPRPSPMQPVGAAAQPAAAPTAPAGTAGVAGVAGASVVPGVAAARGAAAPSGMGTFPTPPPVLPLSAGDVRAIIEPALHEQSLELKAQVAELRRFVVASLDGLATRVAAETRELVQTLAPTPAPAPTRPLGWIVVAALGGLVAVATGAFAWQQQEALERLEARLVEESRAVDALRAELAVAAVAAAQARSTALPAATTMSLPAASADAAASRASLPAAAPAAAKSPAAALPSTRVYEVPYGEAPLAGGRVDALRSLFAGQDLRGFGGTVRIAAHVGDFCLVGTAAEGYAPAPADLPASRCDVTGNPFDDGLRPAQRQSVAFANWLAEMRALAGKRYAIVVAHDGRERPTVPYPDVADAAADAWNAAARANHRVEVAFLPAQ